MKIVLLVEDDIDVRKALRRSLKNLGVEIREAINGLNALELIRGGLTPSLILSDIEMPAMNGLEFVGHRNAEFPHVPLILCSGGNYEAQAAALGVDFYRKGDDLQVLLNRVQELLGS